MPEESAEANAACTEDTSFFSTEANPASTGFFSHHATGPRGRGGQGGGPAGRNGGTLAGALEEVEVEADVNHLRRPRISPRALVDQARRYDKGARQSCCCCFLKTAAVSARGQVGTGPHTQT